MNLFLYQINFQPIDSKGPVKQDKVEVWISHMNDTCLSEQKGFCKDGRNPEANKRGGKNSFSLYHPPQLFIKQLYFYFIVLLEA